MRQFDVYSNPSARSRGRIPYLVAMQSHLLRAAHATIVAPMLPQDGRSAMTETSVELRFKDGDYIVLVGELAVIESVQLRKAVGNLGDDEDLFRRAISRIFTGF